MPANSTRDSGVVTKPDLVVWAGTSGIGGVTESARRLVLWSRDKGDRVETGDLESTTSVLRSIRTSRRARRHIFWCSTLSAVGRHAFLARFVEGETWLFVHGGDADPAPSASLGHFDRVLATNQELADALRSTGVTPELASAFIPEASPSPRHRSATGDDSPSPRPGRVLLACGRNLEWYRPDVGLDAIARAAEMIGPIETTLLLYGDDEAVAANRERINPPGDVHVVTSVPSAAVSELLAEHDTVLRPGLVDGDSLLVREALALERRVVATDGVPRPAGCELAGPTASELAEALVNGGSVSDGSGLGPSIAELLGSD